MGVKESIWGQLKNGFQTLKQRGGQEKEEVQDTLIQFFKFGCLFYVTHEYIIDVTTCIGPSMWPTLNYTGDVVLMDKRIKIFKVCDTHITLINYARSSFSIWLCTYK
jgi:hypothetical protein